MKFKTIMIGILGFPLMILIMLIMIYLCEILLGYYPGSTGRDIAIIAAEKGDVAICNNIIDVPWLHFGPTASDQQLTCVYEYAKLMKDPKVCESLFPLDYGYDCLGESRNFTSICTYQDKKQQHICLQGTMKEQGSNCCISFKSWIKSEYNHCSDIKDHNIMDECILNFAAYKQDSTICNRIHRRNDNMKEYCFVLAKYGVQK